MASQEVTIQKINVYPVKSAHGIELSEAKITSTGFEWDRNWIITRADGKMISQRDAGAEKLATLRVAIDADSDRLTLSAPERTDFFVPLHDIGSKDSAVVTIHNRICYGFDEGASAAQWFSDFLQMDARLVRMDLQRGSVNDPLYAGHENAHSAGQDGFQYLITAQESLDALNQLLDERGAQQVPMSRFRPNIEIVGLGAFGEDNYEHLRVPERDIHLRMIKPCGRCKMVNIDQESGILDRAQGVLSTLAVSRTLTNKGGERRAMFGQNAIAERGIDDVLRVGDLFSVDR